MRSTFVLLAIVLAAGHSYAQADGPAAVLTELPPQIVVMPAQPTVLVEPATPQITIAPAAPTVTVTPATPTVTVVPGDLPWYAWLSSWIEAAGVIGALAVAVWVPYWQQSVERERRSREAAEELRFLSMSLGLEAYELRVSTQRAIKTLARAAPPALDRTDPRPLLYWFDSMRIAMPPGFQSRYNEFWKFGPDAIQLTQLQTTIAQYGRMIEHGVDLVRHATDPDPGSALMNHLRLAEALTGPVIRLLATRAGEALTPEQEAELDRNTAPPTRPAAAAAQAAAG